MPTRSRRQSGTGFAANSWSQRVAGVTILAVAAVVVLPSHVTIVRSVVPAATVEQLLDPSTRQRLGMGSLHLRYALLAAARDAAAGDPPRTAKLE